MKTSQSLSLILLCCQMFAIAIGCSKEESGKDVVEYEKTSELLSTLEQKGFDVFVNMVVDSSKQFPSLGKGDPSIDPQARANLTRKIFGSLRWEYDAFKKLSPTEFVGRIRVLRNFQRKIVAGNGYYNLVLSTVVRTTIVEALLQKLVVDEFRDPTIGEIVADLKSGMITSSRLLEVLRKEKGERFNVSPTDIEGKSEYAAFVTILAGIYVDDNMIGNMLRKGGIPPVGFISDDNIDEINVLALVNSMLLAEHKMEILYGLWEMTGDHAKIPRDKKLFIDLANQSITAIQEKRISPVIPKPYEAEHFWGPFNGVTKRPWNPPYRLKSEF